MRIKRKKYERLVGDYNNLMNALEGTRVVIEIPKTLEAYEGPPFDVGEIIPVLDVTLQHAALLAKFGGYENHVGEVLHGPFSIRFVTNNPATGYERFIYHTFLGDVYSAMNSSPQTAELNRDAVDNGLQSDNPLHYRSE